MSKEVPRRGFLGRIGLGLAALAAAPVISVARSMKKDKQEEMEKVNTVKRVIRLGFQWETLDPFLFCVHHEDFFPQGNDYMGPDPAHLKGREIGDDFIIKDGWRMYHGDKVPGFPGHPHRGFETVTVVRKGMVDHADSLGAAGRYGNGDVQWMTAGKGVQHSEMFPLIHKDKDNTMELFQIWLNLPKKNKMVNPHFGMLWAETIPRLNEISANGAKIEVEVIAGKLKDKTAPAPPPDSWAADANNQVGIWNITMEAGGTFELPAAADGVNRMTYVYEGNGVKIDGQEVESYHAAEVVGNAAVKLENTDIQSKVLVLQGRPINETVISYGPFVMNTKEEIYKAFDDYHATQFGGWPWPQKGQVHDRTKGRFAKHADGREEKPA